MDWHLRIFLSLRSPGRCLRSSNQKLLLVPRSRLKKKGDRAFAIAGPKLWNSLPVSIRTIPTESLLKQGLKPMRGLLMNEPTGVYYFRLLFVCFCFYNFDVF